MMEDQANVPPPPYTEQNGDFRAHVSRDQLDRALAPPSYEPHGCATTVPRTKTTAESSPSLAPRPSILGNSAKESSSSSSPTLAASTSQPKSGSPLSFIRDTKQAYDEKKKAKQAARKVDYYERIYGFMPKNVMSEAEWKKAREDAPKVIVKSKRTLYGGAYLS